MVKKLLEIMAVVSCFFDGRTKGNGHALLRLNLGYTEISK